LMADDLEVSHLHCPRPIRQRRLSPCRCQHAERAFAPDLLDVVAVYDNPLHWVSRYTNFLRFEDSMIEAGVRLTTVETAYGQMPFDLADRAGVRRVRLRANSICWRKENLARLGVAAIPDAQYLALVDGDMLFHDPLWVEQVLRGLQVHRVLQTDLERHHLARPQKRARRLGQELHALVPEEPPSPYARSILP
jgi:hypothetical protein